MNISKIVGNVTLCRSHPGYQGARLLLAEPQGHGTLGGPAPNEPDLVVVWDELGAGPGALVAVTDGAEAAQPFRPGLKAVDAYCSAILDCIHIDPKAIEQLNLST